MPYMYTYKASMCTYVYDLCAHMYMYTYMYTYMYVYLCVCVRVCVYVICVCVCVCVYVYTIYAYYSVCVYWAQVVLSTHICIPFMHTTLCVCVCICVCVCMCMYKPLMHTTLQKCQQIELKWSYYFICIYVCIYTYKKRGKMHIVEIWIFSL